MYNGEWFTNKNEHNIIISNNGWYIHRRFQLEEYIADKLTELLARAQRAKTVKRYSEQYLLKWSHL